MEQDKTSYLYKPKVLPFPLPRVLQVAMTDRRCAINFRASQTNLLDKNLADLLNFSWPFMSEETKVNELCRRNSLFATSKKMAKKKSFDGQQCDGTMILKSSAAKTGGQILRCMKIRNHQAMRVIIEGSTLTISDCMLFIKSYLDKLTLLQCSRFVGIAYSSTAVNWEKSPLEYKGEKLTSTVMIDESLFGKRTRFHRGNPHGGMKS